MKLLTRSQLSSEAVKQRKIQIDEGVKIASRVDALRNTVVELEGQHLQYIAQMKEEEKRVLTGLEEGIRNLKSEIATLEVERTKLLEPLDTKWEEVKNKEKEAKEIIEKAKEVHSIILQDKERQDILTQKIKESRERIRVRERALRTAFIEASEDRAEAYKIKTETQNEKEAQNQEFKKREQELDQKEHGNDQTTVALQAQRERYDSKDLQLADKERAINDKYETLLRTINRTKQ